jgi:transcriptional regulator GlxA family with amidase domain
MEMLVSLLADYITRPELAEELGVTIRTLERWSQQRIGPPATHIIGAVRYRRAAVTAWFLSQEQTSPRKKVQS